MFLTCNFLPSGSDDSFFNLAEKTLLKGFKMFFWLFENGINKFFLIISLWHNYDIEGSDSVECFTKFISFIIYVYSCEADSYVFAIRRIHSCEELKWPVSEFRVWYTASTYWTHNISGTCV